ncbi:MAG: hypothetical protein IH999_08190 [Proteobacteria bacterium]|nr:hypothetical protein [Pseudomonadota bacterium]
MLRGLSIRNVVLIDRLDLSLHSGLCALAGETDAARAAAASLIAGRSRP